MVASTKPRVSISSAFDSGNIESGTVELLKKDEQDDVIVATVELRITKDPYTESEQMHHYQYFAFRSTVSGLALSRQNGNGKKSSLKVIYKIINAGEVSYPQAWDGTSVCYAPKLEDDATGCWKRNLGTRYDSKSKVLTWSHIFDSNGSMYFAYFTPYTYHQHLNLIAKCDASPLATVESLGHTLDGREIDLIVVGSGERIAWIIHRQHPGETMAEYFAEGLLTRLLGLDKYGEVDGNVRRILKQYTFFIVPCMCLDGAARGHLRTNACGANLNREWATVSDDYPAPSLERSPEVYHVLNKMDEHPPDIFLDIHGDEELPFNFFNGAQGSPNYIKSPRMEHLHGAFVAAFMRANSDIQQSIGYSPSTPASAPTNTATKAMATRFDCLSMTLEMPFKDCASNPDPERGWSPNRSRMLGASILEPLLYIRPYLRAEGDFWEGFPKEDAYVKPEHREFKYGSKNEVLGFK